MTKANIMLVEDETLISQDIKEILEELGYNVPAIFDNGSDAIRYVKQKKPDLILMDIAIKGSMDGIKTTEEIHKLHDIPVIYLTSHIDEQRLQRAKFSEPYGYIIKPFDEKTLHSTIEMALYKYKSDSEKQALKSQVTLLNRSIPLTDNEKTVFYGIIKYPDMNDIELARVLKIKRSTVTSIRNRLANEEYYRTYKIPHLTMLGCELLTTMYGDVKANFPEKIRSELANAPEHIYTVISNKKFYGICLARNFTECKNHHDAFRAYLKKEGIVDDLHVAYYPLKQDSRYYFFDYSNYLKKRLGITRIYEDEERKRTKKRELTKTEKKIMYLLVRFPSLSDTELSVKSGIPRPTISKARRSFINEGILYTVNIPSASKLRSELLMQIHLTFDGVMPDKQIHAINAYLDKLASNIFLVSSGNELCMVNAYDDYSEYELEKSSLAEFFEQNNLHYAAENMFTVQNISYLMLDIAPFLHKILDIDISYT